MRKDVRNSAGFWIGLADIDVEGTFMWQNTAKTEEDSIFEAWGTSQPDGDSVENCVAMPKEDYFFWQAFKFLLALQNSCFEEMQFLPGMTNLVKPCINPCAMPL